MTSHFELIRVCLLYIFPSLDKGLMTPDMIIKIDGQGNKIDGKLNPSSEIKMHMRVYQAPVPQMKHPWFCLFLWLVFARAVLLESFFSIAFA